MVAKIILKPGREKPILRRHPWIFSGAIQTIVGHPAAGELVSVSSAAGETLGYAGYSPNSQIRCRMWDFRNELPSDLEKVFLGLLKTRINLAVDARKEDPALTETDAYRQIHAESDQLPGLIVDKYGDGLVVQFLSTGVEKWRGAITDLLIDICQPSFIYERSDAEVRALEGLPAINQVIYGPEPPETVIVAENSVKFTIDLQSGHKTGFYLDQRENRKALRKYSYQRDVLDCFCYTGGFSLNAFLGGAKTITSVDQSEDALTLLSQNLGLNEFDHNKFEMLNEDVFQILRKLRDQKKSFDVIILDPPKFAPTRSLAQKAARGYKDINLLAAKLLRQGGILFTFSCSGGIDQKLFQQIVAGAAVDARADLQIVRRMGQGSDHPVLLNFPEGDYLKGLICRRI